MLPVKSIKTVLISRTDSIGDVVLTLPMAGVLKEILPGVKIIFLGRNYTKDVIALSEHVDEILSYDEIKKLRINAQLDLLKNKNIDCAIHVFPRQDLTMLFKKAQIPFRVGTTNRLYHWFGCNELVKLSRNKSLLHEAQLNLKLIAFIGAKPLYQLNEINKYFGCSNVPKLPPELRALIDPHKQNIILHPKSKGSAREWGLENYSELITQLPSEKYKLFLSGTKEEGEKVKKLLQDNPGLTDITGKMNLKEFIAFISLCDGLIAASTGPLHIAAALGIKAIGLYSPMRPIFPMRWGPIGEKSAYLVLDKNCAECRKSRDCLCLKSIKPGEVVCKLESL